MDIILLQHAYSLFSTDKRLRCYSTSARFCTVGSSGGNIYLWQYAADVTDPHISNPRTAPGTTTDYFVTITETVCNESTTLSTRITVNPLPEVQATSSRNLDFSFDRSQLNVTGANRYIWKNDPTLSNPNIPYRHNIGRYHTDSLLL